MIRPQVCGIECDAQAVDSLGIDTYTQDSPKPLYFKT
jgi:hypothetical protein